MIPYGVREVDQHLFMKWVGANREPDSNWTNVNEKLGRHMAAKGYGELSHVLALNVLR